jgi:hypothetical protein
MKISHSNYIFNVPLLLEVKQLIFPSLSQNASPCDITMGSTRFNLKFVRNLWEIYLHLFVDMTGEYFKAASHYIWNSVTWQTYDLSYDYVSANLHLEDCVLYARAIWGIWPGGLCPPGMYGMIGGYSFYAAWLVLHVWAIWYQGWCSHCICTCSPLPSLKKEISSIDTLYSL